MHRQRKQVSDDKEIEVQLEYQNVLTEFMHSGEETLALPSMNSFYRRIVHQLAKRYRIASSSAGSEQDRHVVLVKNENSVIPKPIAPKAAPVWSFGDREFLVDPLQPTVGVALEKDGTVCVYDPKKHSTYLDQKNITSGAFKIKMNKIIEIQDNEW